MQWNNNIITEDVGMAGGQTWYSIEDLYQAFKDRLSKEKDHTQPEEDQNEL